MSSTDPHREVCNSSTASVQDVQRLQSGHSGKALWRLTRLDTRLRSAGAGATLTSGGQAEKLQRKEEEGEGGRKRKGAWLKGVRKRNFFYLANVLSNVHCQTCMGNFSHSPAISWFAEPQRGAKARMVRGAAG